MAWAYSPRACATVICIFAAISSHVRPWSVGLQASNRVDPGAEQKCVVPRRPDAAVVVNRDAYPALIGEVRRFPDTNQLGRVAFCLPQVNQRLPALSNCNSPKPLAICCGGTLPMSSIAMRRMRRSSNPVSFRRNSECPGGPANAPHRPQSFAHAAKSRTRKMPP